MDEMEKRAQNEVYAWRVRVATLLFNRLQLLLEKLGLDDLALRLDALHHDFYTAVTEGEGE